MTEFEETLDLKDGPMASQQFFHVWIDFKTKKEISQRPFVGSSALKDKCGKSSSVCFLKQRE